MPGRSEIFPEVEGALDSRPPAELVALVEQKRITGVLELHDGPRRWELRLRGGEIVGGESTLEHDDPTESFLELTHGRFRLRQQLLLPDGTMTDRRVAAGALEEFGPVDLVRTCEQGGLNGTLRIKSGGRLVEALFDAGLLTTITLDGHQDVDVNEAWTWTEGEWALLALPALDPPPNPKDSGLEFLREVEVAAAGFIVKARQQEEASWGLDDGQDDSPGAQAPVAVGPETIGSPPKSGDGTVRIVYYDTVRPADDPKPVRTRYADADVTSVVVYKRPRQKIIVQDTSAVERERAAASVQELALAPADRPRDEPPAPPAAARRRPLAENPLLLVGAIVVILGLIALCLRFIFHLLGRSVPWPS